MPVVQLQPFAKNLISVVEADSNPSWEFARQLASVKDSQLERDAFFVADLGRVADLVRRWTGALPRVRPFYSVHCNSDPVLAETLAAHPEVGFCCTTRLNAVEMLGLTNQPERIFYQNPCWTRGSLAAAADSGIQLLGFDSARDLRRISESVAEARLVLNVNVNDDVEDIGCAPSDAAELLTLARDLGLQCVGVGFNVSRARFGPRSFHNAIDLAAQLVAFGTRLGHCMQVLSLGGGFTAEGAHFENLAMCIEQSLAELLPAAAFPDLQVIATPGRFFAASVFSLVTNVVQKERVDASRITDDDFDLGKSGFLYRTNEGCAGAFRAKEMGCAVFCEPLFGWRDSNSTFASSVLGPDLDEHDVLQPATQLGQMEVGDWLLWPEMGAYSLRNRGSLDEDYGRDLSVFYVAAKNNQFQVPDLQASVPSDVSDVESEDGFELCPIENQDDAIWASWMANFHGRERASHTVSF